MNNLSRIFCASEMEQKAVMVPHTSLHLFIGDCMRPPIQYGSFIQGWDTHLIFTLINGEV